MLLSEELQRTTKTKVTELNLKCSLGRRPFSFRIKREHLIIYARYEIAIAVFRQHGFGSFVSSHCKYYIATNCTMFMLLLLKSPKSMFFK